MNPRRAARNSSIASACGNSAGSSTTAGFPPCASMICLNFSAAAPDDVSGIEAAITSGHIDPKGIIAVLGKTEGNGLVNDFARGYASLVLSQLFQRYLPAEQAAKICLVMSGGTEGGMAPHWTVFERSEGNGAKGPALAFGRAHTQAISAEHLGRLAQVDMVASAVRAAMANAGIVGAVGEFLQRQDHVDHIVLDPVMVATSGDRLLDDDAVQAIRDLMPLVSLITPNLAEAAALLDTSLAATLPDMRLQAVALQEMGAQRVLIKGGHLDDTPDAVDLLLHLDGEEVLRAPRVNTVNTHGTGCTLSSALAALRPQRGSWVEAAVDDADEEGSEMNYAEPAATASATWRPC